MAADQFQDEREMLSFLRQRLLRIALAPLPSIVLFLFFTDESQRFLDALLAKADWIHQYVEMLFAASTVCTFVAYYAIHKTFLRRHGYAICLAFVQTSLQLSVLSAVVIAVVDLGPAAETIRSLLFYLSLGLALCCLTSCVLTFQDYFAIAPKYLTPFETLMGRREKKGTGEDPHSPRLAGFLWRDFERGLVVHREEADRIVKALRDEKCCLLTGPQASGKSVILREVAYRSLLGRDIVLTIEDVERLDIGRTLPEIVTWNLPNVLLIVDDVHKNPGACSQLLRRMRDYHVKVLLSSRLLDPSVFAEGEGADLLGFCRTKIAVEVTPTVIRQLIENYCRSIGIRRSVSQADVDSVRESCGNDLWLVTYLLISWDPRKGNLQSVPKEKVYEKIYQTRISRWRRIGEDAFRVMQVASALYAYEIPVSEKYLDTRGLVTGALAATAEGHLIKRATYYELHHASVARMYLAAFAHYSIIASITQYCAEVLGSYLNECASERVTVLHRLATLPSELTREESEIIGNVVRRIDLRDAVSEMEREEDVGKLGTFLRSVASADVDLARRMLLQADSDNLRRKLAKEPAISTQNNFISSVRMLSDEHAALISSGLPVRVALVPVFNEASDIPHLFSDLIEFVNCVLIVDDGSRDRSGEIAQQYGARVVVNAVNRGLVESILIGLRVTADQNADVVFLCLLPFVPTRTDIGRLMEPVLSSRADLVVATARGYIARHYGYHGSVLVMNKKAIGAFIKHLDDTQQKMLSRNGIGVTRILLKKMLRVAELRFDCAYRTPLRVYRRMGSGYLTSIPPRRHALEEM